MRYVIGSGPAGIAAAYCLVKRGFSVTILDAGLELETERQEIVRSMSQNQPDRWKPAQIAVIKEGMSVEAEGVPLKYIYGSDFPYREIDKYIPRQVNGVENLPSLAKAGLSNVWGGSLLPYLPQDIADWPVSREDLAPHYRAVLSFVPISAVEDALADTYPLYSDRLQTLNRSRQATDLIADLQRSQGVLETKGVKFGYSRLAVRAEASDRDAGCVYCGLCMYGCPYGLIYNATSTLEALQQAENFHYQKDVIVEKLLESEGKVQIIAQSRVTGEPLFFTGEKVYLAAGVLPTTKILLESLEAYDRPLIIRDSQYFLLPLLRYRGSKNVIQEKLHTLQQAFIKISDDELSKNTIHLAIYTYNEMYRFFLQEKLGNLYPLLEFFVNQFLDRMILAQGYLHSNISPSIIVQLQKGQPGTASKLILDVNPNSQGEAIINKLIGKLWRNANYFKAIPLQPMLRIAQAGRSFHIGGSFPMKANPQMFETDDLGRPTGWQNLHVVDATVFPSIPATTITLNVMANAHRIAANS